MSQHLFDHEHHFSKESKVYLKTLILLLILTVITVAAAGIDFGSINVVIALSIATVKATLVGLYFMHLRYDKPVNAIIAMSGFLFLGLFLMACLSDTVSRRDPEPRNLRPPAPASAAPGAPAQGGQAPAQGAPPAPAPAKH